MFIIFTNFKNPNIFRLEDAETTECFDSLYLLLKFSTRLEISEETIDQLDIQEKEERRYFKNNRDIPLKIKPIFMCDGLVPIDILYTFATNIPFDSFFCPTAVPAIATSILGDHLRVRNKLIN